MSTRSKSADARWVWFDLDDTLWDFRANSHHALAQVYEEAGLNRFWSDVDSWRDIYHRVNDELWRLYAPGLIDRDTLRIERFARPLREAGCPAQEVDALSRRLDPLYLEMLGRHTQTVPGARELLERLSNDYKIGVLSNGFAGVQQTKLRSSGLDMYVDCLVLSDEIDVNKPDRRLFDYALQKTDDKSGASLLIGDNVSTDVTGALNAGWRAVWFNPGGLATPAEIARNPRLSIINALDYDAIQALLKQ